ncbi:metallophosphoesterase [Kistimonas asteriae]|uniref:metallophosphoesterase n=1 Tax=Kistimonas asteriae TaxID=517724 RepID=UPI001BAE2109|nr:metallophosphoesterase [Kistimonas asteriae]
MNRIRQLFLATSLVATGAMAESVSFIAIGDMGTGSDKQYKVANAIENLCQQKACDFAIGLGDNIYEAGVDSSRDDSFQSKFEQPYAGLAFPFFMSLGNHDNSHFASGGGLDNFKGEYQVAYHYRDDRGSDKWRMPNRYYHFTAPLESEEPLVDFLALDSNPIAGGLDWDYQYWRKPYTAKHKDWIKSTLSNANAPWKIAFAHHPLRSNGRHGNAGFYDGLAGSGKDWQKLIKETVCDKVDVLITGHDHDLQWLKPNSDCGKTFFIVSGAGGKTRSLTNPDRNPAWWQVGDSLGFFRIQIEGNQFTGEAYVVNAESGQWELAYSNTIRKH